MKRTNPQQICRAWHEARSQGLIDQEDTAVIFLDWAVIEDRVQRLQQAWPAGTLHAVAIKTNPLACVLKFLHSLGVSVEAASLPEVLMAANAGFSSQQIVFDSPAKTREEIHRLPDLLSGGRVNADSIAELARYPDRDNGLHLGLRINPLVESDSPGYLNVSGTASKFGEPIDNRQQIVEACLANADLDGLHMHIGSQFSNMTPSAVALQRIHELAEQINAAAGQDKIQVLNTGGGFPVNYRQPESPWQIEQYVATLRDKCPQAFDGRYQLVTEFGRYVHANAAWVVSGIEYVKPTDTVDNLIAHVGADMFLRECYNPADWFHEAFLLDQQGNRKGGPLSPASIAGPLCFGGDFVFSRKPLAKAQPGDSIVIQDVGANTFSLWSRHCSRPFPKVVACRSLPDDVGVSEVQIVKQRETVESVLGFWS